VIKLVVPARGPSMIGAGVMGNREGVLLNVGVEAEPAGCPVAGAVTSHISWRSRSLP
jgi:hypothetical protein